MNEADKNDNKTEDFEKVFKRTGTKSFLRNIFETYDPDSIVELRTLLNLQKEKKQIIERKQPSLSVIFELGNQAVLKAKKDLSFEISEMRIKDLCFLLIEAILEMDNRIFENELDRLIEQEIIYEEAFYEFLEEREAEEVKV